MKTTWPNPSITRFPRMTLMAHHPPEIPGGAFALSTAQEGLWAAEFLNPESSANVTGQYSEILGALDVIVFERASRQVIEETEALRLCFGGADNEPQQWVTPLAHWSLPVIDLSQDPDPFASALAWMKMQHAEPLDVGSGRAFRWTLLRLGESRFVFSFQVHHLLMDGFSRNAVWRRLDQVYSALIAGTAVPPGATGSLRELFTQESEYGRSSEFADDRRYFAQALHNRPARRSLSGRCVAATREFRRATTYLPRELGASLRAIAAGASLARVVTAAAVLLLRGRSGAEDLIIGFAVSARLSPLALRTPSMLSNVVPLRLHLSDQMSIEDLMGHTGRAIREVMRHQRYPSQALRRDLQLSALEPDVYSFVVNFMPFDPGVSFAGHPSSTHNLSTGPVADLTLGVFDGPQTDLRMDLNGNRELYTDAELAQQLGQLVGLLASIAQRPTQAIGTLLARDAALTVASPMLDLPADVSLLGPRFDAVAAQRGDAAALVDGMRRFSYRELLGRADALTAALKARGIGPGDRVGVALPRSAEMVIAIVGIVRSGAAYVPVDLLHPPERRSIILADAHPRFVVSESCTPGIPHDVERLQLPQSGDREPGAAVTPGESDAAYIIYTSGSTGRPNGVRVTQRNVARLFTVTQPLYGFTPSDVWSLFHSPAFDFSVFEMWGALLTGGTLVVVPAEIAKAADAFHTLVLREGVTILSQTPSAFRAFDAADSAALRPANRLKQVIFGGERLEPRTLSDWFDAHGDQHPQLVNMYGITETTVHTTYRPIRAQDARSQTGSPIGVPLSDLNIELLDPEGTPVADGQIGEIWVSGAGVTSGYIERPELTAHRFQPNPRGGDGALRYRSGDLARRRPNGELEYLGRADQQVKVRGFRIELGEIEAALRELPAVRDAVVVLREDSLAGPRLLAYIQWDGATAVHPDSIRARLISRLPEHMVPAAFVRIEHVPRTVNDKVDRDALPPPSENDFPAAGNGEAPRDEIEQSVAEIFCAVLGRPVALRESDFFRLGGHSLLAVRATLLCRERLGIELPILALFDHPTVAAWAAAVRETQKTGRGLQPLAQVTRLSAVPLSPQQRALWLDVQLRADTGAYNVRMAFSATGPLDLDRMRQALVQLARLHEVLRGRIVQESTGPSFRLDRDAADIELDTVTATDPQADFARAMDRPFDLERGPLWRCVLRRLPDGGTLLAMVVHHLVIDARGAQILLHDLADAYARPARPLPSRPYDFADLAAYENQRLCAERNSLEQFWADELAGIEVPELPAPLLPCSPGEDFACVRASRALPPALAARVRERAAELGMTPFHVYFTAYLMLLRIYTARDDLVVGSLVSLRDTPAAQSVLGYLIGPVALRMQLHPADTFAKTVARLARRWNRIRAHARLPMDALVRAATRGTRREQSGSPFQIVFSLLEEPTARIQLGEESLTPLESVAESAKFKLFLQIEHRGPEATLALESQRGVLDPDTGARLLAHLETILQVATEDPNAPLAELSPLAPSERVKIAAWGVNSRPYPQDRTVTELFEEMARMRPHATALVAGQTRWSYRELDERANAVAAELSRLGITRGHYIPLLIPRSAALFACILGVLKVGAAYVPIDPELPAARRTRLLSTLPVTVGMAASDDAGQSGTSLRWLSASAANRRVTEPPPRAAAGVDDAAYVMFTSGSTGQAKGVEIPHRGIVRLTRGQDFVDMGASQSWLQLSPASFDASTLELWAPLLNGGRCILMEGHVPTPALLSDLIQREGATSAWFTASLFNALIEEEPECLTGLEQILIGGEALSPVHVRRAMDSLPHARLVNGYGPTENSTFTCCHRITRADIEPGRSVPIGQPIGNTTVRVLDRDGNPTPIGVPGELVTGGAGVALGYVGRTKQATPRFLPDTSSGDPDALCYRTGDRVRWRSDGLLEFLGRFDEQLKINGHRIEPAEITGILAEHGAVRQAVVVAHKASTGDMQLIAYVVTHSEQASSDLFIELAHFAAERLPAYMVPACFVRVAALPLKPNGKLDVSALPPAVRAETALPRTPSEEHSADLPVLALIGEVLGRPIARDDNLYALGADSLRIVRLVTRLKTRLGLDLPIGEIVKRADVADILRLAVKHSPAAQEEDFLAPIRGLYENEPAR